MDTDAPGQVVVRLNRSAPSAASVGADFVDSLPVIGADTSAAFAAVSNRSGIPDLDSALDAIGARPRCFVYSRGNRPARRPLWKARRNSPSWPI